MSRYWQYTTEQVSLRGKVSPRKTGERRRLQEELSLPAGGSCPVQNYFVPMTTPFHDRDRVQHASGALYRCVQKEDTSLKQTRLHREINAAEVGEGQCSHSSLLKRSQSTDAKRCDSRHNPALAFFTTRTHYSTTIPVIKFENRSPCPLKRRQDQ